MVRTLMNIINNENSNFSLGSVLITSLFLLLMSNAVLSGREKSKLLKKLVYTVVLYSLYIVYNNYQIHMIDKGIGLYVKLINTPISIYILYVFLIITSMYILVITRRKTIKYLKECTSNIGVLLLVTIIAKYLLDIDLVKEVYAEEDDSEEDSESEDEKRYTKEEKGKSVSASNNNITNNINLDKLSISDNLIAKTFGLATVTAGLYAGSSAGKELATMAPTLTTKAIVIGTSTVVGGAIGVGLSAVHTIAQNLASNIGTSTGEDSSELTSSISENSSAENEDKIIDELEKKLENTGRNKDFDSGDETEEEMNSDSDSDSDYDPYKDKSILEDLDDPVKVLLNCVFVNNCSILILLWAIMILFLGYLVASDKIKLEWVEKRMGKRVHKMLKYILSLYSKTNLTWISLVFIILIVAVLANIYFSYFMLINFDSIVDLYKKRG